MNLISKYNSLAKNLAMSLACSIVGAYAVMCIFWLITGMKYNALICCKFYLVTYAALMLGTFSLSVIIDSMQRRRLEELDFHAVNTGFDDEYYRRLREYIGGLDSVQNVIFYASCCIEGERYEYAREVVKRLDFSSLSPIIQEEYFNICLYSALLEGKKELANEIYSKAKLYFDRATTRKKSGSILHTLAELCMANGRYDNAEKLLLQAAREKNPSLRCECCLSLGECMLAKNDPERAKQLCFEAAEEVSSVSQAKRLKQLMMNVQRAYLQKNR